MPDNRFGLSRFLSSLELAGIDRIIEDSIDAIKQSYDTLLMRIGDLRNEIDALLYGEDS